MLEPLESSKLKPSDIWIKGYQVFEYQGETYHRSEQSGTWCDDKFRDVIPSLEMNLQLLYRELYPDDMLPATKMTRHRTRRSVRKPASEISFFYLTSQRISQLIEIMEEHYKDPEESLEILGEKARFLRWTERQRPYFMTSYKMQNKASRTTTFYKDIERALKRRGETQKAA
jgi:hypothetical protein